MKKYLIFDTETTGKADFRAPPDAPHQPRLVQLGATLQDETGRELAALNLIVRPEGFEIPTEASNVHGITTAMALEVGLPLLHVIEPFQSLAKLCDAYVCHNADFDMLIIHIELDRLLTMMPGRETICTMKRMTPVCQLPGKYDDFKWPNLQEAHVHCFQKEFVGAHDAMADVRACRDVFFWMLKNNILCPTST